jgi:Xaa-Pro aminopeptidase
VGIKVKIKQIQVQLQKNKIDYTLFINTTLKDPTILYTTGYDIEYSFLVIPKNKKPIYYVSGLEYNDVKKNTTLYVKKYKKPLDEIKKILKGTIGINHKYITLALFKELKKWKKCRFKPIDFLCKEVRTIKIEEEIKLIKKAAAIGDKIFKELTKQITHFKTEKDIADFIEDTAKKYDTIPSFGTIVASGKHAAVPHYTPQNCKLQKGFCVIDFGVKYKNYISDMTRTIFIGTPTETDKKNYNKVLNANIAAIVALKPGIKCKKIDAIARKHAQFPHSLGHGIGIEVHEAPSFNQKSKEILKENMCFTIEPGQYIANKYGIRIEDDIWLTKKGPIVLTNTTKKLLCF